MYNVPYAEISSTQLHTPFVQLQSLLRTYIRNVLPYIPKIPVTPLLLEG